VLSALTVIAYSADRNNAICIVQRPNGVWTNTTSLLG